MAGNIVFDESCSWDVSGGTFRRLARGVIELTKSQSSADRLRQVLCDALDSNLMYVDFDRDIGLAMGQVFCDAVAMHLQLTIESGPDSHPNPELFDGYVAQVKRLLQLIHSRRPRGIH
jgi:hypothetical protein